MPRIRKIAVVTGSRAEYGLLYWLLQRIKNHKDLELKLLVTGSHLSLQFGNTIEEIEKDGFNIDYVVDMLLESDNPRATAKSVGLGLLGFTDALSHIKPDLLIILGDRFEILSAAQAAYFLRIPIAHIHGGELTMGSLDDSIRHAITKMSNLHFVSTERYKDRVIQLGEEPDRVHVVGAMGLEHLKHMTFLDRNTIEKNLNFSFGQLNFFVAHHPNTYVDDQNILELETIFSALDHFKNSKIFLSGCNFDSGGRKMLDFIKSISQRFPERILMRTSFGHKNFLNILKHCDVMIGNSSSSIIEAPSLGLPSINLGNRQEGRVRADTTINCKIDKSQIIQAIQKALDPDFRSVLQNVKNPYEPDLGYPSEKIIACIEREEDYPIHKIFFDLAI